MKLEEMLEEMRNVNLSYLLLAQSMIRDDKPAAIYRLGISQESADLIESLTPAQILKLAGSNILVSRFRFDDELILGMLTGYAKQRTLAQSHAAILLAGQQAAALA